MNHDELFKELLTNFFAEFFTLFFPAEAAQLRFDSVRFLEQEAFTDFPEGALRRADVVAQVQATSGEAEIILIHIEVKAKRDADVPERMWQYYSLLRQRHRKPVFPVVLYLAPGAGGITVERYNEGVLGRQFLAFEYTVVGLPDLVAEEYEARGEPLAAALAALMRSRQTNRVERKYQGLVRIAQSDVNDARKFLLATIVDRYLPLSEVEKNALGQRAQQESDNNMAISFENVLVGESEAVGYYRGLHDGVPEGILRGQKQVLLRQMRVKFGQLPPDVAAKVEAISEPEVMGTLLERVLTATDVAEMGMGE